MKWAYLWKNRQIIACAICLCTFFSCSSRMASQTMGYGPSAMEEMRIAIIDIKQSYDKQKLDLQLLEEKFTKVEKGRGSTQIHELIFALEKKLAALDKSFEKIRFELSQFASHTTQTSNALLQYRDKIDGLEKSIKFQEQRFDEVVKLKHTLNSISKMVGSSSNTKVHKVCSGDSLEKIARKYETSVEEIKQLNTLNGNTIFIDQELKIPD